MADSISVEGIEDIEKILVDLVPKHARNLMRATVHGVAGEIAKDAKANVPKRTGNLRRSIKVKRRRGMPNQPVSEVKATQGKAAKNDGFYWRFVEHGTSGENAQRAQPFLRPAVERSNARMPQVLREQFTKKLAAAAKREQKKREKKGG